MRNWMFARLQRLAARFGCELVRTSRLNAIRQSVTDLESFSARSGYLRNKHGAGYHAERKVRSRVGGLRERLAAVGEK